MRVLPRSKWPHEKLYSFLLGASCLALPGLSTEDQKKPAVKLHFTWCCKNFGNDIE